MKTNSEIEKIVNNLAIDLKTTSELLYLAAVTINKAVDMSGQAVGPTPMNIAALSVVRILHNMTFLAQGKTPEHLAS